MDTTQIKTDLANDLQEYGSWSTAAAGFMERQLLVAAKWLANAHSWYFMIKQADLSTTDGNKGPYDLPSDFEALPKERRISRHYAYDAHQVPAPVDDGEFNRLFEITVKKYNLTQKVFFFHNPGTATLKFNYIWKLDAIADLSAWPEDVDIWNCLKERTSYLLLRNSSNLAQDAANFKTLSEGSLKEIKIRERQGESKQPSRDPKDLYGYPLHQYFWEGYP